MSALTAPLSQGKDGLAGFRERKLDVTMALQSLADIAQSLGAKSLRERVLKDLVHKLEEDRFHLVVVGEFNHGKTTFVNALLGENALPTGVTPTTAAIHHLRYADIPEATVVYASGRREPLPFGQVRDFAVGGSRVADDDQVDYVEVGYPAPLLKERILLVDTPGVNDLSLQRADITYSYIPRADAVLFLLDAGQILKESERVFLEEKLLKASRDKIVFVITKWDLLSESERAEALGYAKAQLAKLVHDPVVFPVSAEKALAKEGDGGFPDLVAHLTRFLAEERGRILLDNALGEGLSVTTLLDKGVSARRRALSMNAEEIDRRITLLEKDLAGQAGTLEQRRAGIREEAVSLKVGAHKDLDRFVDDVVRQLPDVIDNAKTDELKQYLPAFLEETFRKWAEAESKEIAGRLEDLAERTIALVREDAHDATERVGETLGADMKRLDVQVDTFNYDVGVTALVAVGLGTLLFNLLVGGVLLAAAPVVAYMLKGRIEGEYKKKAKELAPDVVRQVASKVGPKLDEIIDDFGKKLEAWVVSASEELHREVLEVLQASKEARQGVLRDADAAKRDVEAQSAQVTAAHGKLEELRAALWAPAEKVRVAAEAAEAEATA
ncbi:MAG TPA: dynamin family protein [Polyangiaceae bacterium]|nr:dynamin family protein [Polyangiaceae bacterium]